MPGNQITFGVGFNVNESNLNKLKQSLKEIQQMSAKDLMGTGNFQNLRQAETELKKIKQSATEVQGALNRAFNASLGTTNVSKFNAELQKLNLAGIAQQFNSAGAAGRIAFNNLATSVMTSNVKLKQTYSLLENFKTTLANTVKWNIAAGAINSFTHSVSSAFNYVKALDASLTDIRIVTGDSREEMAKFAVEANNAAQALGRQTKEYTNAALAFYQQGLNDKEVQARTEASLKAQNVTGAGTEIVDDLTAVWNGFQVTTENTEKYVDKLAAVADSSASNLSELATAMSKVASTANNMGVDMDQLTAQISTIIATTRQAPETVGNALKTIYARINDIKAGSDEAEISLGNYTKRMASLGISVLDANGRLRDTGSVMEEIGGRWQSMTREQQIYLAQTMAGQRQMNNLIALFDNWQQYSDMLNVSLNAEGALNEKNARYMESLSAHLNQFKAATEGLQDSLIDEEAIKKVVDAGTGLVNMFNNVLTSIGGIKTAGLALSGVLLNTFSSNIANGLANFIVNLQNAKNNAELLTARLQIIQNFANVQNNGLITQLTEWSRQVTQFQQAGIMTGEEAASLNSLMQQYNELQNQKIAWDEAKQKAQQYYEAIGAGTLEIDKADQAQEQAINAQEKAYKRLQSTLEKNLELVERTAQAERRYNADVQNDKNASTFIKQQATLRNQLEDTIREFGQIYNTKGQSLGLSLGQEELTTIRNTIRELRNDLNSDTAPQDYAQKYFLALQSIVSKAQQAAAQTRETMRQGAEGMSQDIEQSMKNIAATIESSLRMAALKQQIQSVVQTLGSIASALGGFRAISTAFKTLENESLSATERVTQFTQSFAMGLSMLIISMERLKTSVLAGINSLKTLAAAEDIAAIKAKLAAGIIPEEGAAEAIANAIRSKSIKEVIVAIKAEIVALYKRAAAWAIAHPTITAIIAITAAAAAIIWGVTTALNAETKALEKAQKKADEAQNHYKELKDAYDELKSSIEDYQTAQDAIDSLTKGTQEWKEALEAANEQVLELLSTYPELAQYLQTDSDGRLTLSQEGQNAVLANAKREKDIGQRDLILAQMGVTSQQGRVSAQEIARKYAPQVGASFGTSNVLDVINLYNQLTDDIKGQLQAAIAKNDTETISSIVDQYQDSLKTTSAAAAKQILSLAGSDFIGLANQGTGNNQVLMQQLASITNQSAANNEAYLNSSYQSLVDILTAQALDVSDLSKEAIDGIAAQVNDFTKTVEDVMLHSGLTEDEGRALFTFAGGRVGDLSNLSQNQFTGVQANLQKNYQTLDFATPEEAAKAFEEAVNNYQAEINKIIHNLPSQVQKAFRSIDTENVSLDAQKMISNILTKAFVGSGRVGFEQIEKILNSSDVNDKTKQAFLNIFSGISKETTLHQLEAQLDAAGISLRELGLTAEDVQNIFHLAAESFETIAERFAKANDILDGLQRLDGISADDYNTLVETGLSNLNEYFVRTAENTYILTGNLEELQEALRKQTFESFKQNAEEAQQKAEKIGEILNSFNTFEDLSSTADYTRSWYGSTTNVDTDHVQSQLDFLSLAGFDETKLAEWQDIVTNNGAFTVDQLTAISQAVQNNKVAWEGLTEQQKAYLEQAGQVTQVDALMSQSIDELETKFHNGEISGEDFSKALDSVAKAEAEANDLDFEALEAYANYLLDTQSALKGNKKEAYELAIAHTRLNKGISTLAKNWDDWMEALDSKDPIEYGSAISELREATADLLNITDDALSSKFFSGQNLEDLELAADGDAEAIERLRSAAATDIILNAFAVDNFEDLDAKWQDTLTNLINYANENNLTAYAQLDDADFIAALNEMISASNMTAEQVGNALKAIGYNAEVETKTDTIASVMQVPETSYTITPGPFGFPQSIVPSTQIIDVPYQQIVQTPAIRALTYTGPAGGNISSNNIGGRSGGKKSGGGGGGGSKKKDPLKPMKAKIDPYHDVNIKIGDTQEGLEKLQKERDKLIGKDAVDNLAKQINLMEREKELLQEKAKIAEGERQRQAEELAALGAIFEKNGDIANYKDLLLNKQNQVNAAIAQANKLEGDERDAYEKYVKDLEQEYKDLESAIKEYDDTQQLLDDLGLDYQDLINEQIEKAIEAFDLEINVKLDLKDAEKEFNDFKKKVIDKVADDNYAGQAASTAALYQSYYNVDKNGVSGGIIKDLREHATQIQNEIALIQGGGFSQIYGDDLAAAADDLKKYNDELMDALEEAQDVIDDTHDHFLDAIDAMQDAFDAQQENLDKIDDLLSHDMEILQLIHGEENFDEMDRLWGQQIAQDTQRLQALQEQQQYWQDRLNDYEKDTDEWKKAMENWQAAFEATNDAMIQSVQNLQSKWENSINSIMTQLRNQTFGGNMDAALEDWDKMTWHSERYLDSIDRANGLLDLQKSYIDMINKTNDPKIQAKLAELEEKQLDALANKEHLREIDLKLAQQQLTVLQAQMALEDAQQAKTKLRLRRDSQGNYTYQYVADEDNIQEKTQEYLKVLNEYRTMANDSLHQDLEDLRDYTLEYYEKLQDAQMKYGDDTEALLAEQNRLYEMYFGDPDGYINALHNDALSSMADAQEAMFTNLYGLNQSMEDDLFTKFLGPDSEVVQASKDLLAAGGEIPSLLDAFVNDSAATAFANINQMTQDALSGPHGLLPEWSSALWNIADQYDNDFVPRVYDAMTALQGYNQEYVNGLAVMQEAANRTTENIALGLAYDTAYTNALNDASAELIDTQKAQVEASEEVYKALKKNEEAFADQTAAAIDAANAMYLYWLALNGQGVSSLPYSVNGKTGVNVTSPKVTSTSSSSSYTSSPSSSSGSGGSGSGSSNSSNAAKGNNYTASVPVVGGRINPYTNVKYATGGLNNQSGLAWLDGTANEPEIVLNPGDTKNILDSVNIVRTIFDRVQSVAGSAAAGLSSGSALDIVSAAGQTVLQDVVIHADFPGVEDASQIKQAFNELINLASQRASGNRRTY